MNAVLRDHHIPTRRHQGGQHSSNWILGIACAVVLLGLLSWTQQRDERLRLEAEAELAAATASPVLQIDYSACPPPAPDSSDLLVIVVNSSADGGPRLEGCHRIAERPYRIRRSAR